MFRRTAKTPKKRRADVGALFWLVVIGAGPPPVTVAAPCTADCPVPVSAAACETAAEPATDDCPLPVIAVATLSAPDAETLLCPVPSSDDEPVDVIAAVADTEL